MKKIPFCPMPLDKARMVSKRLNFLGRAFSKAFPRLNIELEQSGFDLNPVEYTSISIFCAVFIGLLSFFPLLIFSVMITEAPKALLISPAAGLLIFFFSFIHIQKYPRLLTKKKVRDIETNLMYALKHILVQIKSGVPLFGAIASVSESGYGMLSDDFRKLVKEVNTGKSLEAAMDEIALKSPSMHMRRIVWQISNGMKSGSDMGNVLRNIIDNLSREKMIAIRRYGSQLNPLTMFYMMIAVIIPTLGITLLIVFSSFSGIPVTEFTFYSILAATTLLQFMYIGMIKSKRPNI